MMNLLRNPQLNCSGTVSTICTSDFDDLQDRHDLAGLRAALMGVCSRFGRVRNLSILPVNHVGQPRALCFLRMVSDQDEQNLMTSMGIGRFGGEMVLVVNLRREPQAEVSEI